MDSFVLKSLKCTYRVLKSTVVGVEVRKGGGGGMCYPCTAWGNSVTPTNKWKQTHRRHREVPTELRAAKS